MTAIHTVESIRKIEAQVYQQTPSFAVMEKAGNAVAALAQTMVHKNASIIVIAGKGNNGGDGYIAAHTLQKNGFNVSVIAMGAIDTLPPDAHTAAKKWCETNPLLTDTLPPADLYIDALLGIGLTRTIDDEYKKIIDAINTSPVPVLSIDMPSGVCADTGRIQSCAVRATATITFFAAKIGLYTGKGVDYVGNIHICPLVDPLPIASNGTLISHCPDIAFLKRQQNTHKGNYGYIHLIGGDDGMVGALILASRAAAAMGAGKTKAISLSTAITVDYIHPEIMWTNANSAATDTATDADIVAIGMGLGQSATAHQQLLTLLSTSTTSTKTILLDADAINLIAQSTQLKQLLQHRAPPVILTPHPTEAARLINSSPQEVNANRIEVAQTIARQYSAIVVLKGAGTIIAEPHGQYYICAAGNAGLARAGSGDVLAGIIATLLAQADSPIKAVCAGVWLHAAAADSLVEQQGDIGLNINQIAPHAAYLAWQALRSANQ